MPFQSVGRIIGSTRRQSDQMMRRWLRVRHELDAGRDDMEYFLTVIEWLFNGPLAISYRAVNHEPLS